MIRIPVQMPQSNPCPRPNVAMAQTAVRPGSPQTCPQGGSVQWPPGPGSNTNAIQFYEQQRVGRTAPAFSNGKAPAKEASFVSAPAPRRSEPIQMHSHNMSRRISYIEEDIQRSYKRLVSLPAKAPQPDQATLQREYELLHAQLTSEVALRAAAEAKLNRVEARLVQDRSERSQRMTSIKAGVEQMLADLAKKCELQMKTEKEKLLKRTQRLEQMMLDVSNRMERGWVPMLDVDGGDGGSNSPGSTTPSTASFPSRPSVAPTGDGSSVGGLTMAYPQDNRPPSRDSSALQSRSRSKERARGEDGLSAGAKLSQLLGQLTQEHEELRRTNRALVSKAGSKQSSMAPSRISPGGSQCVSPGGSSLLVGRPNFVPRVLPQQMVWGGSEHV